MGQVIAFANNMVMIAPNGVTNVIYTDPVPLGDSDRASCNLNVEYIFDWGAPGIKYTAQLSNDGTNWLNSTAVFDNATAASNGVPQQKSGVVHGAFIRFKFELTGGGTGTYGAVNFDLHVLLDHA